MLVTSSDKHNVFVKSKAWKTGVVHGAAMLPRGDMLKVERNSKGFASEARLTRVQELKQAGVQNSPNKWINGKSYQYL